MNSLKTALALGGGGSRGSYEVGVCRALNSLNKSFDIVTGTSIGAICGALYMQNEQQKVENWINTFSQDEVARNLFIFPEQYKVEPMAGKPINAFLSSYTQNGPSIDPLKKKLTTVFDYAKFSSARQDFGCITYNVSQSRQTVFYKKDMTESDAMERILASTAYFPAFNLVEIDKDYYLDGGFCTMKPWDLAFDMGAGQVIGVLLHNYEEVKDLPVRDNLTMIAPILNLKYYLDFDGPQLKPQVEQGYLETLKYLDQAPGYLYTFYAEDWKHMTHLEDLVLGFMVEKGEISLLEEMKPVMDKIYTFLLGYVPRPLDNTYARRYVFSRILEVMGLIAGISPYQQYHFKDFIHLLLENFSSLDSNPNTLPEWKMFKQMEQKGLKDFVVFFHTAMESYGGTLPASFDVFKQGEYVLPYYLALGWYLINKFQLVFYL